MPNYGIVQQNGKVHKIDKRPDGKYPHCCRDNIKKITPLGEFLSAVAAVAWAKEIHGYKKANGCRHCSAEAAN